MERLLSRYLTEWLTSKSRKPLIVRGARQVGKTWLIRQLAKISNKQLIELNFEKNTSFVSLFASNNPKEILINISTALNQQIDIEHSLIFLDEIQAAPALLSKLRWFAEELPELPIIAAGSLLEFVLDDHSFSMPVGRVSYMHVEPLSFNEFLLASDKRLLFDYLASYQLTTLIPPILHNQLTALFKEYLIIGGLPAAVSNWIAERNLQNTHKIQNDLLATYRDDFAKFKGRLALERLDEVIAAIPKMLGQKFVFSHVNASVQPNAIKNALDLLAKARICHRVSASSANGVPLGSELNEKYFKEIFLDTGLCSTALGLNLTLINTTAELSFINKGGIAEQVVGQLLRTVNPPYIEPTLYYWIRNEKGSSAEIDYLIQHGTHVIPIEVKAGSTGSLKSLHLFMSLKKYSLAVRINSDMPSKTDVNVLNQLGEPVKYTLLSLPFYLTEQIHRLLTQMDSAI